MPKIIAKDWNDAWKRSLEIYEEYAEFDPTIILGPATGGILPAYMALASFDNVMFGVLRSEHLKDLTYTKKDRILIIDDVVGTGATKKAILEAFKKTGAKVRFTSLFKQKKGEWLIMPWETPMDKPNTYQSSYVDRKNAGRNTRNIRRSPRRRANNR